MFPRLFSLMALFGLFFFLAVRASAWDGLSSSGYYGRGNDYYRGYSGVSTSGYYGRGNDYYRGYSGVSTSGYYGRGNDYYRGSSTTAGSYSGGVRASDAMPREVRGGVIRIQ